MMRFKGSHQKLVREIALKRKIPFSELITWEQK